MEQESQRKNQSRTRKNAEFWRYGEVSDKLMDKQNEIQQEKNSQVFETDVENSVEILHKLPETNPQQRLKRYCQTLSETNVSHRPIANTAKLKRVSSATDLRTRLAGCPKGLLITTEPPKSGESYRQRSITEVKTVLKKVDHHHLKQEVGNIVYHENKNLEEEDETLLLELEAVKREREKLQQENERLQDELENRNKVIDHLIDFMKSNLPGEGSQIEKDFDESSTNKNTNRTASSEKV
ncbi:uncharacterized protein LOC114531670 [Dendronephthya gigantea]|uniref:uncharacterized protein LOC114531670 n=1 Tax=Dendronephthya gigantea TaxID=151771 RepID=UPI00106BBDCD|nr:uncharacterized protein LOC114531670 [Dendronephthya gigantea]